MLTYCCPELDHIATPSFKGGYEVVSWAATQISIPYPQDTLALLQLKVQSLCVLQGLLLQVQVQLIMSGDLYTKRKVTFPPSNYTHTQYAPVEQKQDE